MRFVYIVILSAFSSTALGMMGPYICEEMGECGSSAPTTHTLAGYTVPNKIKSVKACTSLVCSCKKDELCIVDTPSTAAFVCPKGSYCVAKGTAVLSCSGKGTTCHTTEASKATCSKGAKCVSHDTSHLGCKGSGTSCTSNDTSLLLCSSGSNCKSDHTSKIWCSGKGTTCNNLGESVPVCSLGAKCTIGSTALAKCISGANCTFDYIPKGASASCSGPNTKCFLGSGVGTCLDGATCSTQNAKNLTCQGGGTTCSANNANKVVCKGDVSCKVANSTYVNCSGGSNCLINQSGAGFGVQPKYNNVTCSGATCTIQNGGNAYCTGGARCAFGLMNGYCSGSGTNCTSSQPYCKYPNCKPGYPYRVTCVSGASCGYEKINYWSVEAMPT